MTASEVLETAMSFLPDKLRDNPELSDYIVPWLNVLLQECLPVENSLRQFKGLEPLTEAQKIESAGDELIYQDEITRVALPYGVADRVFVDDDNDYRSQDMRGRYVNALKEAAKAWADESVVDVYA